MSGYEPKFDPGKYNNSQIVQETHNCFAYGMGVLDPKQLTQCDGKGPDCQLLYHQPGGVHGHSNTLSTAQGRTCPVVDRLIREDVPDLMSTTFDAKCPANTSKIALVVHPGEDYHFFRQDDDGWWSHKDGSNKVKRFDADQQAIWNPQTAARDYRPKGSFLNYSDFCGFYCVPRKPPPVLARGGTRRQQRQRIRHRNGTRKLRQKQKL